MRKKREVTNTKSREERRGVEKRKKGGRGKRKMVCVVTNKKGKFIFGVTYGCVGSVVRTGCHEHFKLFEQFAVGRAE